MKKRYLIAFVIALIPLFAGCTNIFSNIQPTFIPTGGVLTNTPGTVTPIPTKSVTPTNKPTEKPTLTPSPTETPTPTPELTETPTEAPTETPTETPTPAPEYKSRDEALKAVKTLTGQNVDVKSYGDWKPDGGELYYLYMPYDDKGNAVEPPVAVNAITLELFYLVDGRDFLKAENYPLDKAEPPEPTGAPAGEFTAEVARQILSTVPKDKLGIEQDLSAFTIDVDDYVTTVNINGRMDECYGVDVIDAANDRRVGVFYITVDRTSVYKVLDFGEFELIK